MNAELAARIRELIEAGHYAEALRLGTPSAGGRAYDPYVLESIRILTARLRSICLGMASKKMDDGEDYAELERLLRRASELAGEDVYGRLM